jgi:hypothetical protein
MDGFMKMSREAQVVLVSAVLLLIISFFDWQQVSFMGISAGANAWHGIGVLAGLLTIALIAWEGMLLFGVKMSLGSVSEGLVSAGLALLVALLTVIYFLTHTDAQHWPAYLGLILAIAIAVAAVMRIRKEGVQMPAMASKPSGDSTDSSSESSAATVDSTAASGDATDM